jgi:hypothetical protein
MTFRDEVLRRMILGIAVKHYRKELMMMILSIVSERIVLKWN